MGRTIKKQGFTLVELLVGMVTLAILVMLVGSILYYGWVSWTRSNEIISMQRDASLAMHAMVREIRASSTDGITVGNPLTCVNTNGTTTFTWSGDQLVAAGSLNMDLIEAGMTQFSSVMTNGMVELSLSLSAGGIVNDMVVEITPRN